MNCLNINQLLPRNSHESKGTWEERMFCKYLEYISNKLMFKIESEIPGYPDSEDVAISGVRRVIDELFECY